MGGSVPSSCCAPESHQNCCVTSAKTSDNSNLEFSAHGDNAGVISYGEKLDPHLEHDKVSDKVSDKGHKDLHKELLTAGVSHLQSEKSPSREVSYGASAPSSPRETNGLSGMRLPKGPAAESIPETKDINLSISVHSSSDFGSDNYSPLSREVSTYSVTTSVLLGRSKSVTALAELQRMQSMRSNETIAGSCFLDEDRGCRPGTPRPSLVSNSVEEFAAIDPRKSSKRVTGTPSSNIRAFKSVESIHSMHSMASVPVRPMKSVVSCYAIPEAGLLDTDALEEMDENAMAESSQTQVVAK